MSVRKGFPQICLYPVDLYKDRVLGSLSNIQQLQYTNKQGESQAPEWILRNQGIDIHKDDLYKLRQSVRANTCIGVSDGSLYDAYPAHAWCFADVKTGEILLQGQARWMARWKKSHLFVQRLWVCWQWHQSHKKILRIHHYHRNRLYYTVAEKV